MIDNTVVLVPISISSSDGTNNTQQSSRLGNNSATLPRVEETSFPSPVIERTELIKRRFIRFGFGIAAVMQAMNVGSFILKHGVAFYAYSQYAPTTLWGQYFYANATHEAAMQILGTKVLGLSILTVATAAFAIISGALSTKIGATLYNCCIEKEARISISLIDMISEIFNLIFRQPPS